MKKKSKVRILAAVLAGMMILQSPLSVLGTDTVDENTNSAVITEESGEMPADTPEDTADMTGDVPENTIDIAGDTPENTTEDTPPADVPEEELPPVQEDENSEDNTEEQAIKYPETKIQVVYSDVQNLSERRVLDGAELLEIYADGVLLENQPEITLDSDVPEEYYGAQMYTYTIHNLPVYRGETEEQVVYTVKEKDVIPGYTACTVKAFPGTEEAQAESLLPEFAAPGDEVNLVQKDAENTIKPEKKFGNYLPTYTVSGTVTWPQADAALLRPEMESYFQNQFTIVRDGDTENYTAYKIHYAQSEENADVWNYTIEGLFTTKADGSQAEYVLKAGEAEGFAAETAEVRITADTENAELKYQSAKVEEEIKAEKAKKKKATADSREYEGKTSVSIQKEWVDNQNFYNKRFNLWEEKKLQLQYKIGETQSWTDWNTGDLGLNKLETGKTEDGVGFETYTVSELPEKVVSTGENPTEETIQYQLVETDVTDKGYVQSISNDKIANIIATSSEGNTALSFKVKLNIGAVKEKRNVKSFFENITLKGKNADGTDKDVLLSSLESDIELSEPDEHGEYTVSVKNLPIFTSDGEEIVYSLAMKSAPAEDDTGETGDTYEPSYDNAESSNFGTVTERCHKNGKLIITLTGKQNYTATKHWMDDGSEETKEKRPTAELYLWRYIKRDENNYTVASMVRSPENPDKNLVWTIPTNENDPEITTIGNANLENKLEKYNQEGYKYIYLTKEVLTSVSDGDSYEQHMGTYDPVTGEYLDVLPEEIGQEKRADGDRCIYNGGHISNTIVGSVEVPLTKEWNAAAFQDQFSDVSVEFTLQSRPKTAADEGEWKNTATTVSMAEFSAEVMSKSHTASAPQYDKEGKELEYRWIETDVLQNGKSVNPDIDEDGNLEFDLKQKGADGIEREVKYRSRVYIGSDNETTIYNEIADTTDYTVEKVWKDDKTEHPSVTVILYRDNKEYAIYEMTGTKKEPELVPGGETAKADGVQVVEFESWEMKFANLPQYDDSGHEYTYHAEEKDVQGYEASYEYDVENRKAVITNTPGDGPGNTIRIRKEWLDDGNVTRRVPVKVEVYKANEVIRTVTLKQEHFWWAEIELPSDVNPAACRIREVSNGESDEKQMVVESLDKYGDVAKTKHYTYQVTYNQDPTTDDRGMFVVRNRRVGTVNLTVEKEWKDGGLVEGDRLEGATLVLGCEQNTATIGGEDGNTVQLEDMEPVTVKDKGGNPVNVVQNVERKDKTYYFFNLPKYDKDGKVVHYTVTEVYPKGDTKDYTPYYKYSTYGTGEQHKVDQQTITITNKKTGTKEVKFYKLWKDAYNFEKGLRPDIYLTLYQQKRGEDGKYGQPEIIDEYKDRLWKRSEENPNNFWTCTFGHLPKYDDNGAEIFYYARENSKVDRAELDYLVSDEDVYDTGAIYKDEYGNKDVENVTPKASDEKLVLKENGTFVNRISSSVKIEGKKIWANIPSGTPGEDFPQLKIHVDRIAKDETKKEDIATTEKLTREGNSNTFVFEMKYEGENPKEEGTSLLKYDASGNLYEYLVREEIIEGTNYNPTYKEDPVVHNYTITNVYNKEDGNTGHLQVKKTWSGHPQTDGIYPAVEFELYRQYQSNNQDLNTVEISVAGQENKIAVTEAELVETLQIPVAKEGTAVGKFSPEKLQIYAPNGTEYYYYVVEKTVHGYSSESEKGQAVKEGFKSESFGLKESAEDKPYNVTFKNTYEPDKEKVSLTGEKVWEDWDGTLGNRPELEKFKKQIKVYRYAEAQKDGAPAILKEDITGKLQGADDEKAFYLQWEETKTEKSTWTYTISNLDRYAPNSMPWKYVVVEEEVEGYKASSTVKVPADSGTEEVIKAGVDIKETAGDGNITMHPLTNSSLKSASITKKWGDTNDCNLRPERIEVKLQFRAGADTEGWEYVNYDNFKSKGYTGTELEFPFQTDYAIEADNNGTWKTLTVEKLPAQIGTHKCYYRFVEVKIGDDNVTTKDEPGGDAAENIQYNPAGGYQPAQESWTGSGIGETDTTIIKNWMDQPESLRTSLTVKKQWANDSNNEYNTRPVSPDDKTKWEIKVKLRRTVWDAGILDPNKWEDVKDVQGNTVVKRISGDWNSDVPGEVVFDELPYYSDDKKSIPYYYQAVEIPNDEDISVENMGYESGITTVPGQGNAQSVETITNTLNTTSLTLKKEWKDVNSNSITPEKGTKVFFEIKKKLNSGEEVSFDTPKIITMDGETDEIEKEEWKVTISNLPKLDGVTYVVREQGVPSGFIKTEEKTEKKTGETPEYVSMVTNTRMGFTLEKVGENDTPLNGVTFTIYDHVDKSDGSKVLTWAKDGSGTVTVTKVSQDDKYNAIAAGESQKGMVKGLPKGDYILEETVTPAGYLTIPADIAFSVGDDGQVKGINSDHVTFGDNGLKLTVKNKLIRGDVKLTKYLGDAAEKKTLAGVKFDLYKCSPNEMDSNSVKIAENLVTDEIGVLTIKAQADTVKFIDGEDKGSPVKIGLRTGSYYLQEASATADSTLDVGKKVPFTIAANTEHSTSQPEIVDAGNVVNTPFSAEVTFQKTDAADGRAVSGAKFKLAYTPSEPEGCALSYDGGTDHTYTSDENGIVTLTNLTKGHYTLSEVSAEGYDVTGNKRFVCTFDITEEHHGQSISLDKTGNFEVTAGTGEASSDTETYKAFNTRLPGSVSIIKVDDKNENPTALNGAEFRLTKIKEANGTEADQSFDFAFTSGKTYQIKDGKIGEDKNAVTTPGVLTIHGLDWGTYTLEETKAPAGYKLEDDKAVTFEITHTKRDLTAETDGHKVVNIRTAVMLKKTDINNDTKLLQGAEFIIEPRKDSDAFAGDWAASRKQEITVGEDGSFMLEGRLIGGNSYVLTETKAPEGYELPQGDAAKTEFTVKTDGTIDDTGNTEITVKNQPIEISFLKRFEGDVVETGAAGAELTVKGRFVKGTITDEDVVADGNSINTITWITEEKAKIFTGAFIQGEEYILTETKAPGGAAAPTDKEVSLFTWTFKVDEQGNITDVKSAGKSGELTWNADNKTATLWNQPTGLAIYKKGMDTEGNLFTDRLLADCTFEISGRFAPARYQKAAKARNGNANGVETIRVTTNGKDTADNALKGRLIVGETYTIKEIAAPDGYELGTEVRFTVSSTEPGADGIAKTQIKLAEGEEDKGYEVVTDEHGNMVIMQRDYPIELLLEKVNEEGELLAGAEFEITGVFAGEKNESTRTFVSDKTGCIDLSKMVSEYNETAGKLYIYKLQEKKAPGGYEKLTEPIYFRVLSGESGGEIPDTYVEILYGDGQTPEKYKQMLSAEQKEKMSFLTIINRKKIKTEDPKSPTNPKNPENLIELIQNREIKTGDDNKGMLLLLAIMTACVVTTAVVLIRKRKRR